METDAAAARALLGEIDAAIGAARYESVRVPSPWAFPLIALLGPAAVLGVASFADVAARPDEPLLMIFRVTAVVFGLISVVTMFKEWQLDLDQSVRPLAPINGGGPASKWLFGFKFLFIIGIIVPSNLMTINDNEHPIILAVGSFLWLATVPRYFFGRHVKAVRDE